MALIKTAPVCYYYRGEYWKKEKLVNSLIHNNNNTIYSPECVECNGIGPCLYNSTQTSTRTREHDTFFSPIACLSGAQPCARLSADPMPPGTIRGALERQSAKRERQPQQARPPAR